MADNQEYLDELKERRRKFAGITQTTFSDQSTTFDHKALNEEISRVERVVRNNSGTRYAATRKGV